MNNENKEFVASIDAKLDAIGNREQRLEELQAEEQHCYACVKEAGKALSAARAAAAPRLEQDFLTHARHLGFRQSLFTAQLSALPEPGPQGLEEVEFLFGPNPGEPQKALLYVLSIENFVI